ncbi:MAG: nitroreductase family deazaflavin-dependent oxidoreductase [Microbacteriaceae bacterium]|nr:nitroreductase family deazaflavin-dependent oxidoreductase [Microbacteriaceae bacterium]
MRAWWFRVLSRTINPIALRSARRGKGRFFIVRHVGRKSGTVYETPLILAPVPEGFVCELTYGEDVSWYRNVMAAGGCTIVHGAIETEIVAIEPMTAAAGLAACGFPESLVLRILRRREFRLLRARRS